jgi:sugar/nucleoside kinase (ribokinase family)
MKDSHLDVVALGCIAVDQAVQGAGAKIRHGHTIQAKSLTPVLGGNPTNMASGLGRLGYRVAVVGRIGRDMFGQFLLSRLDYCGVDTRFLKQERLIATGTTLALIAESGERCLVYAPGANDAVDEKDGARALRIPTKILFAGGVELLPGLRNRPIGKLFASAQAQGKITVLDTTFDPSREWLPTISSALSHTDILLTSFGEAQHYASSRQPHKIFSFFREHGAGEVILKMGSKGCVFSSPEGLHLIPPPKVNAIDTTGAGDNFAAGFLAARLKGFPLVDQVRVGVTAGALSTTTLGGEAPYRSFAKLWQIARDLPVIPQKQSQKSERQIARS